MIVVIGQTVREIVSWMVPLEFEEPKYGNPITVFFIIVDAVQLLFGKSRTLLYFFWLFIREGEDSKMSLHVLLQAQDNNVLNIRWKTNIIELMSEIKSALI